MPNKAKSLAASFLLATAGVTMGGCATNQYEGIQTTQVDPNSCMDITFEGEQHKKTGELRNMRTASAVQNQECITNLRADMDRYVFENKYSLALQATEDAWQVSANYPEERLELTNAIKQLAANDDPVVSTMFTQFAADNGIDLNVIENDCIRVSENNLLCGDAASTVRRDPASPPNNRM